MASGGTLPEQRVGRYRLGDVLGVGSFATVYRGLDTWLEDTVAVKVLAENHSLNPEVRERFIAEGRSLRRITSPHVVAVHDIGETNRQQPYMVLQYADRGTLADRVRTARARDWTAARSDVLAVARGLAAALEAVHEGRLVHRDLSPGNVLLTSTPGESLAATDDPDALLRPDERLLLADLGMCKDLARSSGLTVAAGTSGFRPPEQQGDYGIVDERADIWSLSALMAWLSEGADLPEDFQQVLRRGRSEEPEQRHPDIAAWLEDVEGSLRERPGPGAELEPAALTGDEKLPHRASWPLVAMLLVGVLLGGLGGVLLSGWDSGPPSQAGDAAWRSRARP